MVHEVGVVRLVRVVRMSYLVYLVSLVHVMCVNRTVHADYVVCDLCGL